ncbi:MAG: hypothetical protein HYS38_05885 [Acidobacteria bacterium]|nr:hypothetical protein [Acidobacteriota bacterium]
MAVPPEDVEVGNVEYLQGVAGHEQKAQGSLRISPAQIVFVAKGQGQFTIEGNEVEYVSAEAQASIRARTADVGAAITAIAVGPILPLLFHKAEKHLLSIEYFEGEDRSRRLALFNVHDHSALAVKKMLDEKLGLTPDYYRNKDRQEEGRKRETEAKKTPAGYWEATKNTMVGDSQYDQVLLEKGKYAVLVFDKYVGFKPEAGEWAKYRVTIRETRPARSANQNLVPLSKSSRLVGFEFDGKQYLFY